MTIAGNGREALDGARRAQPFDVVLMDVQMPEMGGFEATAAIRDARASAPARHMPIVAMTAHAMKGDRERCLAAGMDDYLTKPLDPRTLCALVEQMAGGTPAAAGRSRADDPIADASAGARRRRSPAARRNQPAVRRRCAAASRTIRRALDARDGEALRRAAHGLKGAAANFDADGVVAAARALEEAGRADEFATSDALWRAIKNETDTLVDKLQRLVAAIG